MPFYLRSFRALEVLEPIGREPRSSVHSAGQKEEVFLMKNAMITIGLLAFSGFIAVSAVYGIVRFFME